MGFFGALFSRTGAGKMAAAQNALIAKYMYLQLDDTRKQTINDMIPEILSAGGYPKDKIKECVNNLLEYQFFLFVSIAFIRTKTPPALPRISFRSEWNALTNPFTDLHNAANEIKMTELDIYKKHLIQVSLSDDKQCYCDINNKHSSDINIGSTFSYQSLERYSVDFCNYIIKSDASLIYKEADIVEFYLFIFLIPVIQYGLIWQKYGVDDSELVDMVEDYEKYALQTISSLLNQPVTDKWSELYFIRLGEYERDYRKYIDDDNIYYLLRTVAANIYTAPAISRELHLIGRKLHKLHLEYLEEYYSA